jgi:hypothetical protein
MKAFGTVLPLAIAIAIFPIPIIASVLLVGSDRGRTKCAAFALAWLVGLAAVGTVVLVVADGADAPEDDEPATWVSVLLLALGVALIAAAAKKWRARPRTRDEARTPGWMRAIDGFTIARAGMAGFALSALNPKNLALTVAAAVEIAGFGIAADEQVVTLLAFVVVASVGVATPLVVSLVGGDASQGVLDGLRDWMTRNNAVLLTILFAVIGAKLIGDAVIGFS